MTPSHRQGRTFLITSFLIFIASFSHAYDINNTATVDFTYSAVDYTLNSNTVTVSVTPPPSVAIAEFMRLTQDPLGNTLSVTDYVTNLTPPVVLNGPFLPILPIPEPGNLGLANSYSEGEMVAFRIIDTDHNLDPTLIDTLLIRLDVALSGDVEILRLYEESVNSGNFIGYIYSGTNSTVSADGYLTAPVGSLIDLTYDDDGTPLLTTAPVTASSGLLWLQLSTTRRVVGPGDFTPYSVNIENIDAVRIAPGVEITQVLPIGFSYRSGTTYLNGVSVPDPIIGTDGRTLMFPIGDLNPTTIATIDFIAAVATASPGEYSSTAQAEDTGGVISNEGKVTVLIRDDLFTNRSFLAGRVVQLEQCGNPDSAVGVSGRKTKFYICSMKNAKKRSKEPT